MKNAEKREYIIDAYSGVAGKVLIQETNEQYKPLIIFNYFMPAYFINDQVAGFDWENIIDDYEHYYELFPLMDNKNISDVSMTLLKQGFYIHSYLDHYYISKSDKYMKRHFLHDCATVIDFDLEKRVFYIADNFKAGKFSVEEIKFVEYENALKNVKDGIMEYFWMEKDIKFRLRKNDIAEMIKAYLQGKGYKFESEYVVIRKKQGVLLGIDMYNVLLNECEKMKKYNCNYQDYRCFQIMCNHMSIGYELIEYMKKNRILKANSTNMYKLLKRNMLMIRNMFIKVGVNKNEKSLDKLKNHIEEISVQEKNLLKQVLKVIKG